MHISEEVTPISDVGVSEETYTNTLISFDEKRITTNHHEVIIINSWNRIAVSARPIFEVTI